MAERDWTAGTLAQVLAARRRTHRDAAAVLAPAVAAFTTTAPASAIRAAVNPDTARTLRKASAGLAIATALHHSGHTEGWLAAISAVHAAAYAAGANAAAHHHSGGQVAIEHWSPQRQLTEGFLGGAWDAIKGAASSVWGGIKANTLPLINPGAELSAQLDGLAGDVADLYTASNDGVVSTAEVAAALDAGLGPAAYGDLQAGQAFLDGATALYANVGVTLVDWVCCPPMCGTCDAVASAGPYGVDSAPGPQHPRCECWVEGSTSALAA